MMKEEEKEHKDCSSGLKFEAETMLGLDPFEQM